jgi:hypothetical protein
MREWTLILQDMNIQQMISIKAEICGKLVGSWSFPRQVPAHDMDIAIH